MTSIHRSLYRAQAKPGLEATAAAALRDKAAAFPLGTARGELMTLALFQLGRELIVYWESVGDVLAPESIFGDQAASLEQWPGAEHPRRFVPMLDIFHCQTPAGVEHWRRKSPIERVSGRLARLNPEWASSYIFYHYQLQEERPGSFDKVGLIGLHEHLIFFYQEFPFVVETPAVPGKLTTANTPDHWHDVMFPHFHRWEDTPPDHAIWRPMELLIHRGLDV